MRLQDITLMFQKSLVRLYDHMTHHDKKQRAKVFSELFVLLKNLSKKKS